MVKIYGLDSISLSRSGGLDNRNNPQAPTVTTITGFIEEKLRKMVNEKGDEVISSASVTIDYDSSLSTLDTLTFSGREWRIVSIAHPKDFTNQHTVAYLV